MELQQFVKCDRELISCQNIIWLEGDWNYTRIHQQGRMPQLSSYTLKWYERQLDSFVRVRKDAMVNPAYIRTLERIEGKSVRWQVVLTTGEQLEITRRRQVGVKRKLQGMPPVVVCHTKDGDSARQVA